MDNTNIIFLCGIYSTGFVIFHLFFWKILNWKTELQKLGKINKLMAVYSFVEQLANEGYRL